jgi:hypothetical protein
MKIACLLYGQPRNYIQGYNNLKKLFNGNDVDYYFHAWDISPGEKYEVSPWRSISQNEITFKENIILHLIELYKPVDYKVEKQITDFDISEYHNTLYFKNTPAIQIKNINNTISQMYSRNKVSDLLKKSHYDYDIVVITRFDIQNEHIPKSLNNIDINKVYVSKLHLPRKLFADNFIIAPTTIFKKWFSGIYHNLKNVCTDTNLAESINLLGENAIINPEILIFSNYILHFKNIDNVIYY